MLLSIRLRSRSSSTSKVSVACGGISGGAPLAPYANSGAHRSLATSPTRMPGMAKSQPSAWQAGRSVGLCRWGGKAGGQGGAWVLPKQAG